MVEQPHSALPRASQSVFTRVATADRLGTVYAVTVRHVTPDVNGSEEGLSAPVLGPNPGPNPK